MNLQRNLTFAMVALATMTFGLISCSDDDLVYNNEEIKGEDSTVLVSVNVSSELGTGNAKTRSIGMADDGNGKLSYNFDKLYAQQQESEEAAFDFILTARYGDNISTNLFEDVPIKEKSDGTYYISLSGIQLSIPSAVSTEESVENLKFCGMLVPNGTGNIFNNFVKGGVWKDMAELSRLAANDKKFFVPLYSNTQITTKEYNWGGSIDKTSFNITLHFSMMGTVIRAKFTGNPLANDVYIDQVRMRYSNIRSGLIQWKMGDEQSNGNPNFTFEDDAEADNYKITFPSPILVVSDLFNTDNEVYSEPAWVMPVNSNDFKNDYDIYYHIKGDVEYNNASMVVNYPQDGNTTTHEGGFQYGYVYNLSMKMPESDLMITEFEHLNPDGNNYTMIELYNPTAHKLDLRDYGLVRLTKLTTSSKSWLACVDGSATYASTNFDKARVQDIYINKTTGHGWYSGSWTQSYYYQGPENCKTVDGTDLGTDYHNTFTIFDGKNYNTGDQSNTENNDANTKRNFPAARDYKYTIGTRPYTAEKLQPYELGPGQTVIVGAAGIIWEQQKGNCYNRPNTHYWHSTDGYFNSNYLDNAAKKDRLKYAVAVDNGASHNAHANEQYGTDGGVMQHKMSNIIQLVKKNSATLKYEVIDYPGDIETDEARSIYLEYLQGMSGQSGVDYFVFSRYASVMYPRFLNNRYYQDHANWAGLLEREEEGTSVTPNKAYRMFDWTWMYPSNFYISYTNEFTLENYLSSYYSPGTKTFEEAIYNYQ